MLHNIENEMIQFDSNGNKKFTFTAHMSGTLFIAVNDIYLDESTLSSIEKNKQNTEIKDLLNGKSTDQLRTIAKDRKTLWFEDNIGEILLNISVYRDAATDNNSELIPDVFPKMYREMENVFNNGIDNRSLLIVIICTILITADFISGKIIRRRRKTSHSS